MPPGGIAQTNDLPPRDLANIPEWGSVCSRSGGLGWYLGCWELGVKSWSQGKGLRRVMEMEA